MSKRGRPRLNRPARDCGTPELAARRALLVQGADPALSEYPLGILFARKVIDLDQRNAGDEFGRLYARTIGRMGTLGFDPTKNDPNERKEAEAEQKYIKWRNALRECGRRVFDETVNVCVYRRLPPWMKDYRYQRTSWVADQRALLFGLARLAEMQLGKKAA